MARFLLLFTVAVLSAGCGALLDFDPPDPQGVDGGASDMGVATDLGTLDASPLDGGAVDGALPDASRADGGPPPCRLDSQCDDHVFCNGIEVCASGTCMNGGPARCTPVGAPDCVVGTCDPALDACVLHADDSRCASGMICDGVTGCRMRPMCVGDGDCLHDACHTATCSGGVCTVSPTSPCVDPDPTDCRVAFCHPTLGCTTAPSATRCDDGIPCTTDVCNGDGTCTNAPNDVFCDFDGLTCTVDSCVPGDSCADPTTGCVSTRDEAVCGDWLASMTVTGSPACFSATCLAGRSVPVDPTTGCALAPVCTVPGETCVAAGTVPIDAGVGMLCGPISSTACLSGGSCDDGNPCNGTEHCTGTLCVHGTPPCGTMLDVLCTVGPGGSAVCSTAAVAICAGSP